jgi:hypothetical protein
MYKDINKCIEMIMDSSILKAVENTVGVLK